MSEGEIISRDACREANAEPNPKCALDRYFCGLCYGTTWSARLQCNPFYLWQIHKTSSYYSYYKRDKFSRLSMPLLRFTYRNYVDYLIQWFPIVDLNLHWDSWRSSIKYWNQHKIVNCISPTHRWTNGENESGAGAIFVDYCQTNWLEWLAIAKFSYNNKSKNLLKHHLSTLTMDLILKWDSSHEER